MPTSFRSRMTQIAARGMRQATNIRNSFGQALTSDLNPVPRILSNGVVMRGADIPLYANQSGKGTVQQKDLVAKPATLRRLANTDAVTWAIMKAIRVAINQMEWDIVPKTHDLDLELDRWYEQCCDMIDLDDSTKAVNFASALLSPEVVAELKPQIKKVLDSKDDPRAKRFRLESLFRIVKRQIEQTAILHCSIVRRNFIRPNEYESTTLASLQDLVVSDLLIYDAGVIVKNDNLLGELAELYYIPGYQVYPIALPDRTIPLAPYPAFVWDTMTNQYKLYTKEQLIYMVCNPQGNWFGMSPVEALMYVITASIMGDQSYITELREGKVPPFFMNLGGVTDAQRIRFEEKMNQQINKSGGMRGIVLGETPTEDGKYQIDWVPNLRDLRSMQLNEYMQLTPSIKALAFGLAASDVQIVNNPKGNDEVKVAESAVLANRTGTAQILTKLSSAYNNDIILERFPFDDVQHKFNPNSLNDPNSLEAARADSIDIANGSMARNERRRRKGLRPIPGGNIPTVTTGNQLFQVDSLSPNMGDYDQDITDTVDPNGGYQQPAAVKGPDPTAGDPKNPENKPLPPKRNNATKRKVMSGE